MRGQSVSALRALPGLCRYQQARCVPGVLQVRYHLRPVVPLVWFRMGNESQNQRFQALTYMRLSSHVPGNGLDGLRMTPTPARARPHG
jgi:hypothetical protein